MNFATDMLELFFQQKLVGVGQYCINIFDLLFTPIRVPHPGPMLLSR